MSLQLVTTLGPSSQAEATWRRLLAAGATGFRLNTSHLTLQELLGWLERLEPFLTARSPRPPLVLDLQGSKWRLGRFPRRELAAGQPVRLVHAAATENPAELPVPHADFFQAAAMSSAEIVLDDARLLLRREAVEPGALRATVLRGGPVTARKGITYLASTFRQEALAEADEAVLAATRSLGGLRYALSYVRDAADVARFRQALGREPYLIAKLERPPAVDEAPAMAGLADEVWLCRGDLGAELGLPAMAATAHRFARQVPGLPMPALLAGQVFEHLTAHPTPTRAEVCAAYDALAQGYAGFVLSDETAIGQHPEEACHIAAMLLGPGHAAGADPAGEAAQP